MNFTEAIVLAVEKVKAWIQSGGVKWDHVSDKPFVKVGGDTLTWDGNTEGLVSVADVFYKVSDAVPTMADLSNGATYTVAGEAVTVAVDNIIGDDTTPIMIDGVWIVPEVAVGVEFDGLVFPKSGIYFPNVDEEGHVESLTIPNYTGFAKEQIDPKVLPEALQFGENTVMGDTLTWDGVTDGLVCVADAFYKVSDVIITDNELANGFTLTFAGEESSFTAEDCPELATGVRGCELVWFIAESGVGVDLDGIVFPEPGIYFVLLDGQFVSSLTIPNYTAFSATQVVPIDKKFLPQVGVTTLDAYKNASGVFFLKENGEVITKNRFMAIVVRDRLEIKCGEIGGRTLTFYPVYYDNSVGEYASVAVMHNGTEYTLYTAEYTA